VPQIGKSMIDPISSPADAGPPQISPRSHPLLDKATHSRSAVPCPQRALSACLVANNQPVSAAVQRIPLPGERTSNVIFGNIMRGPTNRAAIVLNSSRVGCVFRRPQWDLPGLTFACLLIYSLAYGNKWRLSFTSINRFYRLYRCDTLVSSAA